MNFIQKFKAERNGILVNQVDTSSSILPNESCLADTDGIRITQKAKHMEGLACGLAQLELSQVRRTRGEETAESSRGWAGWPSRSRVKCQGVKYQGLHWFWAGNGEPTQGFWAGNGIEHDRQYTLMRVVRRQSGRNYGGPLAMGKKERRPMIREERRLHRADSSWNVRIWLWERSYHHPHLKAGAEEAWANEIVAACGWLCRVRKHRL